MKIKQPNCPRWVFSCKESKFKALEREVSEKKVWLHTVAPPPMTTTVKSLDSLLLMKQTHKPFVTTESLARIMTTEQDDHLEKVKHFFLTHKSTTGFGKTMAAVEIVALRRVGSSEIV